MPKYILSSQAQQSLRKIKQYTIDNFGIEQEKKYLKALRSHMRNAAAKPETGKDRSEIKAGYFSVLAEKHIIFYRVRDTQIEIIDVLHQSMDIKRRLSGD